MSASEGRSFRVLVVDDNRTTLDLMREFFGVMEDYKVEVITASGGQEAITALEEGAFDVVFTDVMMPDMDGFELLRRVVPKYPELPVVTMTAYIGRFRRQRALDLGAFDFLEKPFRVDDLTTLVDRVLARRGETPA